MAITKKCEECGGDMQTIPSRLKVGKGRYCKKECFDKARNKKTAVNCANCGKPDQVPPSKLKNKNYFCNIDCKAEWQRVNLAGKGNPMYGVDRSGEKAANFGKFKYDLKVCIGCGDMFQPRNADRMYCKNDCYLKNKSAIVERVCLYCGGGFTTRKSEIKKGGGKYCKNDCYLAAISNPDVKRNCKTCGIVFDAKASEVARGAGIYCKPECCYADPERSEKISEMQKALWADAEYKNKMVDAMMVANSATPNNLERFFDGMTPKEVRFVGNGMWWRRIGDRSRNPDFKVTGQPKVIELFGDYWHRNDDPEQVVIEYAEVGIECLVFWESEVYKETDGVLNSVKEFISHNKAPSNVLSAI